MIFCIAAHVIAVLLSPNKVGCGQADKWMNFVFDHETNIQFWGFFMQPWSQPTDPDLKAIEK